MVLNLEPGRSPAHARERLCQGRRRSPVEVLTFNESNALIGIHSCQKKCPGISQSLLSRPRPRIQSRWTARTSQQYAAPQPQSVRPLLHAPMCLRHVDKQRPALSKAQIVSGLCCFLATLIAVECRRAVLHIHLHRRFPHQGSRYTGTHQVVTRAIQHLLVTMPETARARCHAVYAQFL